MKRRTIVWRRMRLRGLSTAVFLMPAILSLTLTGSEGTRRSVKNPQSIKNDHEPLSIPNLSKTLDIEFDRGSSAAENNPENSPALNSFLRNVLLARNELKWIDQAVHRTGAKETQEKSRANYLRASLQSPAVGYRSKIRSKRRSVQLAADDDLWPSSKLKYFEDENSERVYHDDGIKVQRHANPATEFDEPGYRFSRKNPDRSILDDRLLEDESALKHWEKKKRLQIPVSRFDADQAIRRVDETPGNQWSTNDYVDGPRESERHAANRMDEFSKRIDDWAENERDEREARSPSVRSLPRKGVEEPTLESLKKTVLELRKSLEDSDEKNMDEFSEKERVSAGITKNRERQVEDISGRKEGRARGEHERAMPSFTNNDKNVHSRFVPWSNGYGGIDDASPSNTKISGGSIWWNDPRSAADIFDFKKRYDDADDEDDDEDSEPGNSEFDYMPRRVKREKDHDRGLNGVKVYRRAGFGVFYPEKKALEGNPEDENNGGRVYSEIREKGGSDKINNEGNFDGVENGDRKSFDINANENGHSVGAVKEINKLVGSGNVEKNVQAFDDTVEKSAGLGVRSVENGRQEKAAVAGTVGDSNLKDTKNAGFLSTDDKRSSSPRTGEEEHKQRLSAEQMSRDQSVSKSIKSPVDELVKTAPMKSLAESISREEKDGETESRNTEAEEKKEVDKSEPNDDDDLHKLSQDTNEEKVPKDDERSKKIENTFKNMDTKTAEDEAVETDNAKSAAPATVEKITDDKHVKEETENEDKLDPPRLTNDKELNSADKITADQQHEDKSETDGRESEDAVDRDMPGSEAYKETNSQDSELVKIAEPEGEEIKNTDTDDEKEEKRVKNDVAGSSKEGVEKFEEKLTRNGTSDEENKYKQDDNCGEDKRLVGHSDKENKNYRELVENEDAEAKDGDRQDSDTYRSDKKKLNAKMEKKLDIKRGEDLTRKLLWLSDQAMTREESKTVEIRDGRRDSAWDQNRIEKSGQRPANFLKNNHPAQGVDDALKNRNDELKFVKRSLMVANDANNTPAERHSPTCKLKKRKGIRSIKKESVSNRYEEPDFNSDEKSARPERRSVESYPENVEEVQAEISSYDKEEVPELNSEKRSLQEFTERRRDPGLAEDSYEPEDDGVSQDEKEVKPTGVKDEGENDNHGSSLDHSSYVERDRDPMRDRINMLIKQKLDDRGKGRLTHFKREVVDDETANIQYYDYDADVNGDDSDSAGVESDQKMSDDQNSNDPEGERKNADQGSEPVDKKNEYPEDAKRREKEQENMGNDEPKEQFISEVELLNQQTTKSPTDTSQLPSAEYGMNNILQEVETDNQINGNQAAKSNSHWLGEPADADSEREEDSRDREGGYRNAGEPVEHERTLVNEKTEVLGDPLEYSVNVHGKLDPESFGAMLNEGSNAKENESEDNEKRSEKLQVGNDEDWKYEEIRGKSRPQNGQKIEDEDLERDKSDQAHVEKSSPNNWRYGDSARIEEGNNDRSSLRKSSTNNRDEIVREKRLYSKETVTGQDIPSREARLVVDSGQDTLPTMLDRSGPMNLAPGERTYLVIAPSKTKCPRKQSYENSSTSGSNYLALKITDDMFKGGIEQGNPIDDEIPEASLTGKTTTEWKVINMGDNARAEPPAESYGSSEADGNFDSNSNPEFYNDGETRSRKNVGMNPRDVVHESFVDPEEMTGDFDDDTRRPRFGRDLKYVRESHRHSGRSLKSVSYPLDPFERVGQNVDWHDEGERPVEKYLKNTQAVFENSQKSGHRIGKRSVTNVDHEDRENSIKTDENASEKKDSDPMEEKTSGIISLDKNLTGMVNAEDVEKRTAELKTSQPYPSNENDNKIDKDKRGLTNVEEWEMNTPTVQKQHLISSLTKNSDTFSRDVRAKDTSDSKSVDEKNVAVETTSKTDEKLSANFDDSVTTVSHEREIRSVKLGGENFKSDRISASHDLLPRNRKQSKKRGESKTYDKFRPSKSVSRSDPFSEYVSSLDANQRYKTNEVANVKRAENLPHLQKGVVRYKTDWKKSSPKKSVEGIRRKSKRNERRGLNHDRHKSRREDGSNHRHYRHPGLKKHHDKNLREKQVPFHGGRTFLRESTDSGTHDQLKSVKSHNKESSRFKEVSRNHEIQRAMDQSHSTQRSNSMQAEKENDSGNGREVDKKVLDENAEDPTKVTPEPEETQKKKFTVLLAADNMEDESQMDLALHGELAGKIVERIFDQVQKNDALKIALGPGLYRKHKSEDAIATDKIYRQGLDEDEVKHTEGMMRRVMELLGRLILDEVQRKTCASLPPDMREFLQWMLGVEDDDRPTDQVPPLPFVHNQEPNHRQGDKFLFEDPSAHNENVDFDELNKKVRVLKSLINEYNSLTDKEKTKVQTVHDFLVKQLELLLSYIESKEAGGNKNVQGGGIGSENILQYQNAVPNGNTTIPSQSTISPLVNTPSILMLSNASFVEPGRGASSHLIRSRRRQTRNSEEGVEKKHKKRKHGKHEHSNSQKDDGRKHKRKHKHKKKKKKQKHHHHHQNQKQKRGQSPEYKKLIRRAAMLRKKRANLYEDNWDPIDSGYEEPAIYTSLGQLTNKRKRSFSKNTFNAEDRDPGKLDGDEVLDEKSRNPVSDERDVGTVQMNSESNSYKTDVDSKEIIDGKEAGWVKAASRKDLNFGRKIKNNNENAKKKRDLHSGEESKGLSRKPASEMQAKRDVLRASIDLQPWLNPKPNDLVSPDYLKELTDQLVRGSLVPPIYPRVRVNEEQKLDVETKEGRELADDEAMLLSKREAWKTENEQQLEEVAFGKDMRGKWKEKEQFEKLTEMDRKKNPEDSARRKKREGDEKDSITRTRVVDSVLEQFGKEDNDITALKNMNDRSDGKTKALNYARLVEEKSPVNEEIGESTVTRVTTSNPEGPGAEIRLNFENSKNSNATIGAEESVPKNKILDSLEESNPVGSHKKLTNEQTPKVMKGSSIEEGKKLVEGSEEARESEVQDLVKKTDEVKLEKWVKPLESLAITERIQKDKRSLKNTEFFDTLRNRHNERTNSEHLEEKPSGRMKSDENSSNERNAKRSSLPVAPEVEGSAILPLLEVSEQRQQQKQAAKTEKDDQRDIADQMLGFESPLIVGLNTY